MTLDRLTTAQLEELTARLSTRAHTAHMRVQEAKPWIFGDTQGLRARALLRQRIFQHADDILYRRYIR